MKVYLLVLLCLATHVSLASNTYERTTHAGMVVTVKKGFMEEYKNVILDSFLGNLKEVRLQDTSTSLEAQFVSIHASVSNMQLNNAKLGLHEQEFILSDQTPTLFLKVDNIGFNFTFDYNLATEPPILKDQGIGHAYFDNLKMVLSCTPHIKRNQIQIEINDLQVRLTDINLQLKGGDISSIVNYFIGYFKDYLKLFIIDQLNTVLRSVLQYSINDFLSQLPKSFRIDDTNIYVNNLARADNALVTTEFWAFETDGTYFTEQERLKFNRNLIKMPRYIPDGKDVQLFLSEYSINSALESASTLGYFTHTDASMSLQRLEEFISRFTSAFGQSGQTRLVFSSKAGKAIVVKIKENVSTLSSIVELHIANPHDYSMDAAVLELQVDAEFKLLSTASFRLAANFSQVKTKILAFRPLFQTNSTVESMSKFGDEIGKILLSASNEFFQKGVQIPISEKITKYIKDGNVRQYNGFILMEGAPLELEASMDTIEWSKDFVSSLIKLDHLFNVYEINKDKIEMHIRSTLNELGSKKIPLFEEGPLQFLEQKFKDINGILGDL